MKGYCVVLGLGLAFTGYASGQVLHTIESIDPLIGGEFGFCVAPLGDINGDTHDDLVVGAPFEGVSNTGHAHLFSGVNGS
jgi:hypothetical protein